MSVAIGCQRIAIVVMLVVAAMSTTASAQSDAAFQAQQTHQGVKLDLTKLFRTRSAWRFVVTEGTPTEDYGGNEAPGALRLCLYKGPIGPCLSDPVTLPLDKAQFSNPDAWSPHYLLAAKTVYPRGPKAAPLLLIITGSLNSGDGDQVIAFQLVAYNVERDAFSRVYGKSIGHHNNQEVRFISDGPLRGNVISAEPNDRPPYGYWVVVNKQTDAGAYRQILRYRSATLYNDGNSLGVIDSEMPNIQRRLGLWKAGQPIPTPHGKLCLRPVLRHTELWCN